jgi:hypothetical protein
MHIVDAQALSLSTYHRPRSHASLNACRARTTHVLLHSLDSLQLHASSARLKQHHVRTTYIHTYTLAPDSELEGR